MMQPWATTDDVWTCCDRLDQHFDRLKRQFTTVLRRSFFNTVGVVVAAIKVLFCT